MKNRYIYLFAILLVPMLWYTNRLRTEIRPADPGVGFDRPDEFAAYFHRISTPINGEYSYKANYRFKAWNKLQQSTRAGLKSTDFQWVERGPGNVSGRTRAILVDPDDPSHKTWFAGSASGGIWKTTDAGASWQHVTASLPSLSTTTLAMPINHSNVIYAGTGEGFGGVGMVAGNGIFKSLDKGNTWVQLPATAANENFKYVNRIVVHPNHSDTLLVATNKGVFKSMNGGSTWDTVYYSGYNVQDLTCNPLNFNTLYAGVRFLGVIKSTNMGESWKRISTAMPYAYRHEIDVSSIDTSVVGVSVEAPGYQTKVYISFNGGDDFYQYREKEGSMANFLGVQGWFNNIIKAHPYNRKKFFIGGVNLGAVEFNGYEDFSEPGIIRVDTFNTASFLDFVGFSGYFLGGGVAGEQNTDGAELLDTDWSSVEIRFGNGKSQFAHRFTVPEGEGPGVSQSKYTYRNYTQVPFEAWDTQNNKQLMVSFRDQLNDGEFNLVEQTFNDQVSSREYVFIHALPYDTVPYSDIATDGGQMYKRMYFIWPVLAEDAQWTPGGLPESRISIVYGTYKILEGTSEIIADDRKNEHVHVDHHELVTIITDTLGKQFSIIDANDGGLAYSTDNGLSWEQITNGYNTTQFYGVAKKAGEQKYLGGMQDNGTWRSALNQDAGPTTKYSFMTEGDGFESLWHPQYPNRMMASSYNNLIYTSIDTGRTWELSIDGIQGDGPFVTRFGYSVNKPNRVVVAGNKGVYMHHNFGLGHLNWNLVAINDSGWTLNDNINSNHIVEVSKADPNIIWAGEGMNNKPDLRLFLSKNGGKTFDTTGIYTKAELGYITNIESHPIDSATAYALFSIAGKPKILRTQNFGRSWHDISGFGPNDTSDNGFQDVMVYSLLVFPGSTETLWAGTEIGILESTDNGQSWHQANNGLPPVSVWQMQIQDGQVIIATHGRGIWTSVLPNSLLNIKSTQIREIQIQLYPNPADNTVNITMPIQRNWKLKLYNAAGKLIAEKNYNHVKNMHFNCSNIPGGQYIIFIEDEELSASKPLLIKH